MYVLSEQDVKTLKKLLESYRQRMQSRRQLAEDDAQSPDWLIVKTPTDGIDGLTEIADEGGSVEAYFVPGSAELNVWRLKSDGTFEQIGEETVIIHNVDLMPAKGDRWAIAVRDKFGAWLLMPGSCDAVIPNSGQAVVVFDTDEEPFAVFPFTAPSAMEWTSPSCLGTLTIEVWGQGGKAVPLDEDVGGFAGAGGGGAYAKTVLGAIQPNSIFTMVFFDDAYQGVYVLLLGEDVCAAAAGSDAGIGGRADFSLGDFTYGGGNGGGAYGSSEFWALGGGGGGAGPHGDGEDGESGTQAHLDDDVNPVGGAGYSRGGEGSINTANGIRRIGREGEGPGRGAGGAYVPAIGSPGYQEGAYGSTAGNGRVRFTWVGTPAVINVIQNRINLVPLGATKVFSADEEDQALIIWSPDLQEGYGPPSEALGYEGDYYLDSFSNPLKLYGPKVP